MRRECYGKFYRKKNECQDKGAVWDECDECGGTGEIITDEDKED